MSQDYRPFTAVIKTAESGLKAKYNLAESPTKPAASPTKSPKSKANKDRFGSIFGGSIYAHEAASTSPKEADADATRSSPPKATLIQGWHAERHPKWGVQTQAAVDTRPPITSVVVEPPPQEDAAASKPSPPKATLLQGFHAARHPKWGVQAAQTATTSQPIFPSEPEILKTGTPVVPKPSVTLIQGFVASRHPKFGASLVAAEAAADGASDPDGGSDWW